MKHIFRIILTLLIIGCVSACKLPNTEPVECICKCETECTYPEATAAETTRSPAREPKTEQARKRRAKAARAQKLKNTRPSEPTQGGKANTATAGVVTAEPGTGRSTDLTEPQRAAMGKAFTEFLAAAKTRDLDGMKAWSTQRLSTSLDQSLPRYEDRLFNSLRESISALPSGLELGEARKVSGGNVEIQMRFGNGHERRPVFFEENGQWRLNRL